MTDGSKSPKFGKFHPLDKWQNLARSDQVKYIEMRGDDQFVQAIRFKDKTRRAIMDVQGTFTDGITHEYELEEDEKIIGVYGIYNYQPYIVGLGFILWTPKPSYTTEADDTI